MTDSYTSNRVLGLEKEVKELGEQEVRLRLLESKVDTLLDCALTFGEKIKQLEKKHNELVCCVRYTAER